ncbi:MAG TPA: DUF503 domain-containing protein [Actinomycetota bacterium]|jgi:uncharacterized protein YlxP (DUF503 family)|nr:DUF503 domain-containing protein [Actinomycetota bacterium]
MFVGVGRFDFLVPGSTSLKEKRRVVQSMIGTLSSKFNVAVAEVEHQDLRQRGTLGISCVSNSSFHAQKMLHEVERYLRGRYEVEIVDVDIEVMVPDA